MSKPKSTFVTSSTGKTTELGWRLKRIHDSHAMRQRKLMEEMHDKSRALTDELQAKQSAVFEELRVTMGISDADWGDGKKWALNIENLADGAVALVHETDETLADNCDCPICQTRRLMASEELEEEDELEFVTDPTTLH